MTLPLGFASMRQLKRKYKYEAKKRGLKWDLTEEQFKGLTQQNCYYCGAKPNQSCFSTHNWLNGEYIYNGLDRIDNTKGYTIDNVVPCCRQCNQAKSIFTLQEFQNWIEKVYCKLKNPNN
jgi:hypothetical protein